MRWRLVAAVPILTAALTACADLDRLGSERMRDVPLEQLCFWRGNPISGRQMARELERRGERCVASAEAAPGGDAMAAAPPAPATVRREPEPEVVAAAGLASAPPPPAAEAPPRERIAASETAAAPLVAPACAERILRRGDAGAAPRARAVAFRNRCAFPIRVLYAAASSSRLSSLTGLLQPGESSGFAPIEDGFDQPGYVVCSYAEAEPSQACRLGPGPG